MSAHMRGETGTSDSNVPLRRYARSLFSVPITIRHLRRGGVETTRGMSLDLAEGGLGAMMEGALQVGDTVAIDLQLRDHLMTTVAIVRHTSRVSSGFEFVGLTAAERQKITSLTGKP